MMEMKNLRPLFFLQEKLDQKINSRFREMDEETKQEHFIKKVLSFRVEVGELLNALRLHKYWSTKGPQEKEIVLDEYADGLHFLLSIAGDKKITSYVYEGFYDKEYFDEHILWLFDQMLTLPWGDLKKDDFLLGLEMYLKLGDLLGFTWKEINEAYVRKNLKNHERQLAGY